MINTIVEMLILAYASLFSHNILNKHPKIVANTIMNRSNYIAHYDKDILRIRQRK